ncbi:MAG: hypothetical protein ACI88H_001885 [Cocleimonas sp.]|jgi:hypothetical protein
MHLAFLLIHTQLCTIRVNLTRIFTMQLALLILAALGALLFIISYLGYVVSGFKHHFVTGLISTLPVLNIITLPSLWDKSSRKFIVGLIGLIIFIGAWFLGADKGIQNLISGQSNTSNEKVIISVAPNNKSGGTKNTNSSIVTTLPIKSKRTTSLNESNMLDLPNKALYKMGFEVVPVSQISTLQGRIVQITKTDNLQIEGRIKNVSPGSVILEGIFENELPIASIKQLRLMVKKPIQ